MEQVQSAENQKSLATLMVGYINVCNKVLEYNETKIPYRQILAASQKLFAGKLFNVIVVNSDDDKTLLETFVIRFNEQRRLELVGRGNDDKSGIKWKVKKSYLERVIDDPKKYIENPIKLDWDWLTSHLNIE